MEESFVKGSVNSNSTSLAVCFSRAQKGRKQKQLSSSIDFSNTNCQLLSSTSCMPHSTSCFGLRLDSFSSMGTELTRSSLFRSRPIVKALASGGGGEGDMEEGATLFGYHFRGGEWFLLSILLRILGLSKTRPYKARNCLLIHQWKFCLLYKQRSIWFFRWVVSTLLAGATVGSFTGGSLADKFGRTRTFQLDAIPLTIGALLCATAQSVQTMIIGRLLAGIGIGISSAIVPLYISEISPTEIRGALGSINQLFICIGILLALVAGLPLAGNPIWWRTMFGISAVPAVLLALGMAFSPESPRWLFQV
ncbi:plastidic glucose transporter 4-like isoform X2 [Populus alba x Populus x berolinensis]|nr:plastidic glucose transporter 4-like isoform X2 [Populus alba x Populus x berolinensis]